MIFIDLDLVFHADVKDLQVRIVITTIIIILLLIIIVIITITIFLRPISRT